MSPVDKVLAIRRTMMPAVWSALILLLAEWGVDLNWLTSRPVTLVLTQTGLSGLIYLAAITLGPRLPWLEAALLTSTSRPAYQPPGDLPPAHSPPVEPYDLSDTPPTSPPDEASS